MKISFWYDESYLGDPFPRECTSVGVLVHTGTLNKRGLPLFLLLEQLGREGNPWGIPAGRTEAYESHPRETAAREILEETGIQIDRKKLEVFLLLDDREDGEKVRFVYSYRINSFLDTFPRDMWDYSEGVLVSNEFYSDEIGRMAILNGQRIFENPPSFVTGLYKWGFMHSIKVKLKGLRVF